MESLALVVSILVGVIIFSSPIGIFFTRKRVVRRHKRGALVWVLRRVVVTSVSVLGLSVATIFLINGVPLTATLISAACIALNLFVLYREYLR